MAKVIDFSGVIDDDWVRFYRFGSLGAARQVLVAIPDLVRYPHYFERTVFELGVDLQPDDCIEDFANWLPRLGLVCLNFAAFSDGRAFSQAKLLRERFACQGDIRAQGEVLRDQLSFMHRCGINQFSLAQGESPQFALAAFADISDCYQPELAQVQLDRVVNS